MTSIINEPKLILFHQLYFLFTIAVPVHVKDVRSLNPFLEFCHVRFGSMQMPAGYGKKRKEVLISKSLHTVQWSAYEVHIIRKHGHGHGHGLTWKQVSIFVVASHYLHSQSMGRNVIRHKV
jgi:hypothetical protein